MKTIKNTKNTVQALLSGFFSVFFFMPSTPPKKIDLSIHKAIEKGQEVDKKSLQEDYKQVFNDLVNSYQKMI